jgi:hypothetical protein
LGIGPNPQSPIPNPQSPIPNPHQKYEIREVIIKKLKKYLNLIKLAINLFRVQ